MKPARTRMVQFLLTWVAGALLLAACNLEGVVAFSPNNDRIAVVSVVSDKSRLYSTDSNGGNPIKLEDDLTYAFDVTFDPLGTKLLYAQSGSPGKICTIGSTGAGKVCPVTLPGGVASGFLSFLPNGDYILVYQSGGFWQMYVYQPAAALPYKTEANVDHFFLTSDAYEVKRGSNGTQWYLAPYDKPGGQQNLRWVIVRGNQAIMYNAAGSLEGPTPHPRDINSAVRTALGNVLNRHGVSLVLSGEGNSYERTRALMGNLANPRVGALSNETLTTDGVVFVRAGSGGRTVFGSWLAANPPPWSAFRDNTRAVFLGIQAGEKNLVLKAWGLDVNGRRSLVDELTIRVPPPPPTTAAKK